MILFDSHCHIDDKSYDKDLDEVLGRADREGVKALMVVGIDLETTQKAIAIARGRNHIITSTGIHPHDASHCSPGLLDELTGLARDNDCVRAWGETGLDFNRMYSPQKDQETCFSAQIGIAADLGLPLIFHERDSRGRFYEILKSEGNGNGVVHCFSGTKEELFNYLDLGYSIGITGILTIQKRGAELREMAPLIPEDRILIETDAPYLTPAPIKNKVRRNEPAFVKSVLLRLAEIRNTDPERLSEIIFENTQKLYGTDFTV
ncbi:TatD family hydrolase [Desulfospira joergensenii]|uniref:TatD family hydrolase n=1 Tax=Desulfospira joergensenii TaxID=53329 RepID=UPI0003B311A5|nr:TatD family hydrolase [Desulfospira joergensenii]